VAGAPPSRGGQSGWLAKRDAGIGVVAKLTLARVAHPADAVVLVATKDEQLIAQVLEQESDMPIGAVDIASSPSWGGRPRQGTSS